MDYEKIYNEALKRAKAAIDIAADKDLVKGVATTIFPELRESEDERMMRVICLALTDVPEERFTSLGTTLKDCLAHLEKQKETLQNSETHKETVNSFTSEDERIRRVIVNLVSYGVVPEKEDREKCLAYLEKQKDAFENGRQLGIMQEQARQELEWPDEKQKEQKPQEWS